MRNFKNSGAFKVLMGIVFLFLAVQVMGCAHMITAIEHSDMQVKLKMSDTIFLDPVIKAKNRTVYVVVNNTSDMQEVDTGMLLNLITDKLTTKGYQVISDPTQAGYIIHVNVLYMDYYRQTGVGEGAIMGALLGGAGGALLGQNRDTSIALGLAGATTGGIGGALIGKVIKVETYAGVVDIQIKEKTDKPVTGQIITNVQQGSSTTIQTRQEVDTNYQTYKTRIACTAKQTNIDKNKAAKVIAERIATQLSGFF